MSLSVDQILRWHAMNIEHNAGNVVHVYQEEDLWLESAGTKGTLSLPRKE